MGSPSSLLYDPAIFKILNLLRKKLLKQILADFQRLGAKVVFADSNRIIIATNKTSYSDAEGYARYVIKSIRSSPIFHSVHMEPVNAWRVLLWMDRANFGGVRYLGSGEPRVRSEDDEPFEDDEDAEPVRNNFNRNLFVY
jgi:DNA polymerase epsilon subunit 1